VTSNRAMGLPAGLRWVQRTDTTAADVGGAGMRAAMIATAVSSASREERLSRAEDDRLVGRSSGRTVPPVSLRVLGIA
jgi:hypothetical protein